jgi:hypothetical protein
MVIHQNDFLQDSYVFCVFFILAKEQAIIISELFVYYHDLIVINDKQIIISGWSLSIYRVSSFAPSGGGGGQINQKKNTPRQTPIKNTSPLQAHLTSGGG